MKVLKGMKRILAMMLIAVMVLTLVPSMSVEVKAEETYTKEQLLDSLVGKTFFDATNNIFYYEESYLVFIEKSYYTSVGKNFFSNFNDTYDLAGYKYHMYVGSQNFYFKVDDSNNVIEIKCKYNDGDRDWDGNYSLVNSEQTISPDDFISKINCELKYAVEFPGVGTVEYVIKVDNGNLVTVMKFEGIERDVSTMSFNSAIVKITDSEYLCGDENDLNLYAKFKSNGQIEKIISGGMEFTPDTYTVTFDANGGSGTQADVTDISGTYTLPTSTTFIPPVGKTFAGWSLTAGGAKITGATIDVTENKTLYAVWKSSAPTPDPKSDDNTSAESTKVYVDLDTNKSEVAYGTVFMHNKDNVRNILDMKVHSVDARTKANQEFLAASYAKNQGKRARVLITTGIYPRNKLYAKDLGNKKFLSFVNLEKKVMPVYAACYNQTDKAYYLTGTMNANGTAVFTDFIARDATNITIFVLE